ncbi:antibiotic biosynthesis monooxygenase family protein [Pontibacter sp. JAM-7]|uniref:antibiotic biosynthesis monooxygenase family protein n=1 Tax=Pontibacter sp. JAM-7 TaxID=3366581 RepID=UPI003AF952DB
MFAVIFEVWLRPEGRDQYLEIAAEMREKVAQIEGFISVERFQSLTEEGKLVSLSFWQSEAAIQQWRQQIDHGRAQSLGRHQLFKDYRLRVAHIMRDYGPDDRQQAPNP